MQTFHPDLIRHMDARDEQRSLAARLRMARAGRRNARRAEVPRTEVPAATGAASVIRTC
jgi:hypothetical protein